MAISDKIRWNERFAKAPQPNKPLQTLEKYLHLASGKYALDIACGLGRNTRYLLDRGYCVDAVDISDYALARLPKHKCLNKIEADLDEYAIAHNRYNVIVNANFLMRSLYADIVDALQEGGLLFFETFIVAHDGSYAQPSNPDYLLREGELSEIFASLYVIEYREYESENLFGEKVKIASFVGRKDG